MLDIKIYNSLTNKLESFVPLENGKVSMYVCGPTVYSYPHIGNLRPVVSFDVVRRLFERVGYEVTHMSNITDIDDKIIKAAIDNNCTEKDITDKYEANFYEVCEAVNALRPTVTPHATTTIPEMVKFIQDLIDNGFAYEVDGDVYFRVKKVPNYGCLSHFDVDDLKVGARIEENTKKEDPLDFALWKNTDVGIKFPAPFGDGRPGWHTECVVMIKQKYPTARIDIHGGGFDLKFPHHENEIAQAQALFNHSIATYWMHNGFINIDNVKMSKSLGNVKHAKDIIAEYTGKVLRMVMLESHYRAPLNISDEVFKNATNDLNKIESCLKNASIQLQLNNITGKEENEEKINKFLEELAQDFNTSNALTEVYNVIKDINNCLRSKDYTSLLPLYNTLVDECNTLGIKVEEVKLTDDDKEMFNKWYEARNNKDFETADIYRNKLLEKGLI